jgi:hypothetical protein
MINFLRQHCFDSLLGSAGQAHIGNIVVTNFVIVLGCITAQNGCYMWVLLNDYVAAATQFPGPDLALPLEMLLFIAPIPSSFLVPAIKVFPLASKNPLPGLGAAYHKLNRAYKLLHLTPYLEFGYTSPFKAKAALFLVPIEAPLASQSSRV